MCAYKSMDTRYYKELNTIHNCIFGCYMTRERIDHYTRILKFQPYSATTVKKIAKHWKPMYVKQTYTYDLVVSRYNEDIHWVNTIDHTIHVIIYNKGENDISYVNNNIEVITLPNIGRESHTMATHCSTRYERLADYTIFCQGDTLTHSPYFFELLENKQNFNIDYTSLSLKYLETIPPPHMIVNKRTHLEEFNCFTLNSVQWHDKGTVFVGEEYLQFYELPHGTNILRDYFTRIGLDNRIDQNQSKASFSYGAIFAVNKDRITQHSPQIYDNIANISQKHWSIGFVIEKSWYCLFI